MLAIFSKRYLRFVSDQQVAFPFTIYSRAVLKLTALFQLQRFTGTGSECTPRSHDLLVRRAF